MESPPHDAHPDPDLLAVIRAWPDLPEAMKAGILAMVKSLDCPKPEGGTGVC